MKSILEIGDNGIKRWYLDNDLHREDGPAIEYIASGTKYWYRHGKFYKIDGPTIEYSNGRKAWYLHGKRINCSS